MNNADERTKQIQKQMEIFAEMKSSIELSVQDMTPAKRYSYSIVRGDLIGDNHAAAINFEWPKKLKDLLEDDLSSLKVKKFMMNAHRRGPYSALFNVKVELTNEVTSFDVRDDAPKIEIENSYDFDPAKDIRKVHFKYHRPGIRGDGNHFYTQVRFEFDDGSSLLTEHYNHPNEDDHWRTYEVPEDCTIVGLYGNTNHFGHEINGWLHSVGFVLLKRTEI